MSEESEDILPGDPNKDSPRKSSNPRRASLRPSRSIGHYSQSRTSNSPPERFTRKRAASIDTASANNPRIQDLAINSASSTSPQSGTVREQVCLCQPDPKIPRPRNAFILYRQHYQAQIVAQNPGLANPEISKIIGEQWRDQPVEVKDEWKRLAEEEKQRHHRQYPDYRYQPRRAGKLNGARLITASSPDGPARCPRCNGRYISAPSTPSALLPLESREGRHTPVFAPSSAPIDYDHHRLPASAMSMPRTAPANQPIYRRPGFPPSRSGIQASMLRDRDDDMEGANPSPEQKRRRYIEGPGGFSNPSAYGALQRMGRPQVGYIEDRRSALPGLGTPVYHSNGGIMEPLPRLTPGMHQYSPRTPAFDESLRLPPLQTQIPGTSSGLRRTEPHQRTDSQARSVEAMVMTIPHISKIKVLAKISPSLAPAGPLSPAQDIRGAIIAIEGSDRQLLADVGKFIEECLNREPEFFVKTWGGPPGSAETSEKKDGIADVEMTGTPSTNPPAPNDTFIAYLDAIRYWHEKSDEVKGFSTTDPNSSPPRPRSSSPTTDAQQEAGTDPTSPTPSSAPLHSTPSKHRIPVALFPSGFSLTTSDTFASSIPINDAYAPVDHWQWMATLWRGIVGPDLTVYVKAISPNDREGMEEMSRYGNVEIRHDCAAIIVRVEMREGRSGEARVREGNVEEKILRRLGFEVLEFVRIGFGAASGGFRN